MQPNALEQRWARFQKTRDPALREELITQYTPLVKYVVDRMAIPLPDLLSREDVLSYGTIGLIQAVDRFDPDQGLKFQTYAIQRIRGSVIDAIRALQPVSRGVNRRVRLMEHAYADLTQRLGRTPQDREVAEELGLSADEFQALLLEARTTIVSLDAPLANVGDDENLTLADRLADESEGEPSTQAERRETYRRLVQAIEELPERERLIISLYYHEELTLREIAEVLGLAASRISQLHTATILKLRATLRVERALAA